MKVFLCGDRKILASLTAELLAKQVRQKPDSILGLATGRTMESIYAELVARYKNHGLDFSSCTTFNLDEYVGLHKTNKQSYHYYMNEHLFRHINIEETRTHLPDGMAHDLILEGQNYDEAIGKAGGIDLQLLGLGENGHIGFNEPLSSFKSRSRLVVLSPESLEQNSCIFGGNINAVPVQALTMGIGTIMESRKIILTVSGKSKSSILKKFLEGPITAQISATALHYHNNCLVLADEEAASELTTRHILDHFMLHDPELKEIEGMLP